MYAPDSDDTIRWRGVEIPHFPPAYGYVYLIHFHTPYKHAAHYLGSCVSLDSRLAQHRAGNGARLMEVVTQAHISWEVSRIWRCESPEAARLLEKRLKSWSNDKRLCPLCKHTPPDAYALAWYGHYPCHLFDKPGRRQPMKGAIS